MTPTLNFFGTYVLFALWQSTFWLAVMLIFGRFYRRSPWKAHVWYMTGIFAATLTPLFSTLVSIADGGVLAGKFFPFPSMEGSHFAQQNGRVVFPQTLGLLCAVGTTLFVLALLYSIAASRRLMFHATPFPDRESQEALLRHSKSLRNLSLPVLFTSPGVKSPTVWCWGLHPAVLLPESLAEELRDAERDAVFLHEISHIIRRDHLTSLLARLCGVLLFWNPLYWLVLWQSDIAADQSCDQLVLTQGNISPEQYKNTLLRLVAGERSRPVLQFLSRKEKIMKRIDRILNFVPTPAVTGTPLWTASVFTAAMMLCVALAFCQEGKQAITNQAGEYTLDNGVKGTVTLDGKPVAGAVVTFAPKEPATVSPIVMSEKDIFIFDKGIWTNKGTGKELPAGTIVQRTDKQGADSTFRLDVDAEGFGSVVHLTGPGASGKGNYIEFSDGGNAIRASQLTSDQLEEIKKTIIMGENDVFIFGEGVWQDAKTFKEFPPGTLVQGTKGIFRLDKKDEEGQVVVLVGGGASGHGKNIRLSHGGNAFAGRETPFPAEPGNTVPQQAIQYKTPEGGYTHLVLFAGKGDFSPKTPKELLDKLNAVLFTTNIATGYFRTWPENNRLIGGICASDTDGMKKTIESIPDLELISMTPLNEQSFSQHTDKRQESLPSPRLLEIEQSDWFGKLNELQKAYVQWDENSFAYAYDSPRYDVGNDRAAFESRWAEELAKPEPGYPGSTLTPYDEAIFGLAKIKSDKALRPLLKIATERVFKDNAHRHFATKALGILGDPAAVPELIPLVYHFNINTRWEAQVSLVRLTGQNFGSDAKAWGEWYMAHRDRLGEDLPEFDPTPVDWACGSNRPDVRQWCDPAFQKEHDSRGFGMQRGYGDTPNGETPVVIKMEPANGATDVDAQAVKELRVTFDIDMSTNGYSWCGGGEMFPRLPENSTPMWIDKRTCVMPVELESGKSYLLGINAQRYTNFKSAAGVPVAPLLYKFSTKP